MATETIIITPVPTPSIPETVRRRALAAGAEEWLAALPGLVASLAHDWGITIGDAFEGGSEALVAPAVRGDGTEAVLKVLLPPGDGMPVHEISALRLAGGDGAALLLESDPARGAMLLERLGERLGQMGLSGADEREILLSLARRFWRPAAGHGFPTGAEKARWLAAYIPALWEDLARPCSERAVTYALDCLRRRELAHDDERSVLVHGDIHAANALRAEDGFKLVDPDGLFAEAEYDLGVLVRADPIQAADPRMESRRLAARTGLSADAIWEWAAGERLATGLLCTRLDLQPFGRDVVANAEHAAAADG